MGVVWTFLLSSILSSVTRGNSLKLNKPSSRLNRQNFFSQRVINDWNQLLEFVISSTSVNGFKNTIERHFQEIYGVFDDSVT